MQISKSSYLCLWTKSDNLHIATLPLPPSLAVQAKRDKAGGMIHEIMGQESIQPQVTLP
jgi:hypothetical protein